MLALLIVGNFNYTVDVSTTGITFAIRFVKISELVQTLKFAKHKHTKHSYHVRELCFQGKVKKEKRESKGIGKDRN
jgi:hypothetical protein